MQLTWRLDIGVASYGVLGHVPPFCFQLFNFSGLFETAQILAFDSKSSKIPVQRILCILGHLLCMNS